MTWTSRGRRAGWGVAFAVLAVATLAGRALGHGAVGGQRETLAIPFWLFLSTGGGVVGASFLLASFVTDRAFIDHLHGVRGRLALPASAERVGRRLLQVAGLLALGVVVAAAFLGPPVTTNLAVLGVWIAWWTGLTMVTYSVGNGWPALNPWRTLAGAVERLVGVRVGRLQYPERVGAWPAVAGLLALVWLEVASPVGTDPRVLGAVVCVYTVVTVAGALLYGPEAWFDRVDPVANVFRAFGTVAPVARRDGGFEVAWPGARLADPGLVEGRDESAFLIALVWATTFDGLVSTPTWVGAARAAMDAGVPRAVLTLGTLVGGFALFFAAYALANRLAVGYAETRRPAELLRDRFAPALLPIAVGYHLAHYLGYLLSTLPTLVASAANPLSGVPDPQVLVLPGWFGALAVAFVLLGHLLAIWVAHAIAFEVFPDRLQAIRSQYPTVAVMVGYTMVSLWIVTTPSLPLP